MKSVFQGQNIESTVKPKIEAVACNFFLQFLVRIIYEGGLCTRAAYIEQILKWLEVHDDETESYELVLYIDDK